MNINTRFLLISHPASFGKSCKIMEFQDRAVIQYNLARKEATDLAAGRIVEKQPSTVYPLLMGNKRHLQAVVIAGKPPGRKPIGHWYMEGNLVKLMQYPVNKKAVFCPQRKIRLTVANTKA